MESAVVASQQRRGLTRFVMLLALFLPVQPIAAAEEQPPPGYIRIAVVNKTFRVAQIQIRDEVCREPRSIECEEARIKATGELCQKAPGLPRCQEAAELLKSSLCVEGLVFDGRMVRDRKIYLDVCASEMGLGNISVRTTGNGRGIWTNYALVSNGREIGFH